MDTIAIGPAADRAGVSTTAIERAIKAGRIRKMAPRSGVIQLVIEDVDRLWPQNTQDLEPIAAAFHSVPTVYRLFDQAGLLLYVGVTGNVEHRLTSHARIQPWWGNVTHFTRTHFKTRREADRAEALAIRTEHPIHNLDGLDRRIRHERLVAKGAFD